MPDAVRSILISGVCREAKHTLGTIEELGNLWDAKAALERLPHVGSQAIAPDTANIVDFVESRRRTVEKVACRFAYIDEHGRFRVSYVGPEVGEGELASNGEGDARQHAAQSDDSTGAMVSAKT